TDSTTCNKGNDGSILATVTGGAGTYTYQWSNMTLDTNFNNNLTAGFYTLSVTDDNNCTTIDTVNVDEPEPVVLTFSVRPPTCYNGGDGWATATISGGNAPYSLIWVASPQSQDTLFGRTGGRYYTAIATDAYGCTKADSVFIPNPDSLIVSLIATDEACQSGGDGTVTANVQGGYAPYSYFWDAASGNQTASVATNLVTGNYGVTITDSLGCQVSETAFVGLWSGITVTITPTNVLCKSDATGSAFAGSQGGSGSFQYQWSDNQTSQTAINLIAGDYTVTITDAVGCEEITSVSITEPRDFLDISVDSIKDVSCFDYRDGYLRIRGVGGVPSYQYSLNGGAFGDARIWTGLVPDNYTIAVQDSNDCVFEEVISIIEPSLFAVDLGEDIFMTETDTFTATPIITNGVSPFTYNWTPADSSIMTCMDCLNPLWTGLFNTTYYTLMVTDSTGCVAEDDLLITLLRDQNIYVATGFSPNNNGTNDRLFIQGDERVQVTYFRVYDRWGELVFESRDHAVNDPNLGWDGTFNGQAMNIGTFGWVAEVVFLDGKIEVFKGNVVLIR
ncbi:MAG: gliding motility-associated C-terminal domain-containing protein, partial [Saprospiraceae bacterium]